MDEGMAIVEEGPENDRSLAGAALHNSAFLTTAVWDCDARVVGARPSIPGIIYTSLLEYVSAHPAASSGGVVP